MEYKTYEGTTLKGHWEYYGTVFDGDNEDDILENIKTYIKDNFDLSDQIKDAINDTYYTAADLYDHMECGYDVYDVKDEAIETIMDDMDALTPGEGFEFDSETFEWISEDEESEEEKAIKEAEERLAKMNVAIDGLHECMDAIQRATFKCIDADINVDTTLNAVSQIVRDCEMRAHNEANTVSANIVDLKNGWETEKNQPTEAQPGEAQAPVQ